ncbi:acyl-homoserine lactone synthase [Peteryoungia aggregata LMG 23059]|uniref:Acyl-homoserine-lactone synthase n=1 Tax=Peteryoungia aggregata LMG 23059 TaxID=1368425 RepID=A0ABU0G6S9_9HYPH|nr:acyl-homoserine-lactone synthase [Peteryoungia aggregata]MDQ0421053.1 acyl-homoserine lactone synthase [Peteryoungia aggregata LMG 23059]
MLATILGADAHDHALIMEQVWRFRHHQFVERLGWEACRRSDDREIDQFDGDEAIHLPLIVDGAVVGYSRLLPTTRPHLLSDVYPHLMDGADWPRGARIFEWTRCISEVSERRISSVPISNILMTGVMEYCLVAGIETLVVETHPKLVNLLVSTGWEVMPLAAPSVLDGSLIVPITARPSRAGLLRHHELYGINGSVLDLERAPCNPFGPAPLVRLPFADELHGSVNYARIAGE